MLEFRDLKFLTWSLEIKLVENYFFLETYSISERAVSHNVLYYQPLPITRYQVRFNANNHFLVITNSFHCFNKGNFPMICKKKTKKKNIALYKKGSKFERIETGLVDNLSLTRRHTVNQGWSLWVSNGGSLSWNPSVSSGFVHGAQIFTSWIKGSQQQPAIVRCLNRCLRGLSLQQPHFVECTSHIRQN